jgi:hypothetical protein
MKPKTFLDTITVIESTYNDSYKDEAKRFMWKRFKGLSDDEFSTCSKRVFDTFVPTVKVPLPLIPHFIRSANYTEVDKAITAIEKVKQTAIKIGQYESINFGDVALHRTIEYFGGWPVVAMWGEKDWNYNEKKFSDTYKTFLKTSHGDKLYILIGLHEESNSKNGYDIAPAKTISLPWSKHEIDHKKNIKLPDYGDIVKGV